MFLIFLEKLQMDYKLFQSKFIQNNYSDFVQQCNVAKSNFNLKFGDTDLTWQYDKYNIFSLTSGSILFFDLFKELRNIIKSEIKDEYVWIQSWMNFHTQDQVLDWHNHSWQYHGYICIDPKNTTTEFENYTIYNKIGQIYFGPGNRLHKVNVIEPYDGHRITIGYDITTDPIMDTMCFGLFPLI